MNSTFPTTSTWTYTLQDSALWKMNNCKKKKKSKLKKSQLFFQTELNKKYELLFEMC